MLFLFYGFLAVGVIAVEKIVRAPHQPTSNGSKLLSFTEATQGGSLYPSSKTFNWVQDVRRDGDHITIDSKGALVVENIVTQKQEVLIPSNKVPKPYRQYWVNTNLTKVLWATRSRKQYRYSYFADYVVQDINTGNSEPLVKEQNLDVQYAVWNPTDKYGNIIAFVRNNDMYIWKDGNITRITTNGGPDQFNGVPDWVYEEEILSQRSATWWKPEGDQLAYLSINEKGVPSYRVQYYMDRDNISASTAPAYPRELEIRYPKVGATNPTVKANLLKIDWGVEGPKPLEMKIDEFPPEELIIGEVAWLGERVGVRTFNRVQDQSKFVVYDTRPNNTPYKVVKSQDGTDGWLDNGLVAQYVGQLSGKAGQVWKENFCCEEYYLDKIDLSNWDHLYLFPTNWLQNDPIPITWGDYDVREVLHVDRVRSLIYYTSSERHPTESHVYGISYRTLQKFSISDVTKPGFSSASFSPGGGYYVLSYQGPNVPYQELYSVEDNTSPIRTITNNSRLVTTLNEYKLPMIRYADLKHPTGYNLSAVLRYPANFNASKKYPVLLTPYGGPGAQEVTKRMMSFDFKSYIAADPELEFITFTVDGRGTGMRGRGFRASVSRHLGQYEAEDQIWAAQTLAKQNKWVDSEKIAIWGWSFGGYLSAKVVEADSGTFSLGLITAPVTDWRLYDSMYTERYMGLPSTNSGNYTQTAIRRVDGFKNIAGGVLMQHGLGDDNVHFQNSAALIDLLVGAGVGPDKLQVQYFTDSDHGIGYNGANKFLYRQLAKRLFEEKMRPTKESGPKHQWSIGVNNLSTNRTDFGAKLEAFMAKLDAVGSIEMSPGTSSEEMREEDLSTWLQRRGLAT
ncbi:putative dipeptidyl peptidase 4 [Tothia fuscella]|uniref:dipeptidyl-peptidase IV n=1 Tax=Tothia fuscella TaxID=1048955 RepID=A0A9P4TZY0_9PEZI|nr:putative dipeptidyl peptidase 4 [Tothia fuscella]